MLIKAATIAGSDTSGGAGIQADLKTFNNYGVYGVTALTSMVTMDYQNEWAHDATVLPIEGLGKQLKTIFDGIRPQAFKSGMLPTAEMIQFVSENIPTDIPYVLDPVMACKGAEPLFPENAIAIREYLLPLATIATPNIFEAQILSGLPSIETLEDAKKAAIEIHKYGCKMVVIKAIPYDDELIAEVVFDGEVFGCFTHPKLENKYTHGAGCTFSAAITAQLALGKEPMQAIADASSYVFQAIDNSEAINVFTGALMPQ